MKNLEELIIRYVNLTPVNNKGWHTTLCKVCNDAGRKGPRAGFRFELQSMVYNCFNCGISGSYAPKDRVLSDDMSTILTAYGIPEFEINSILFQNKNVVNSESKPIQSITFPSTIKLMDCFYPLTNNPDDDWCQYSIQYLTERHIDWTSQPFYCVNYPKNKLLNKWFGRLIIPIYYNDNLIFYQGRDLTDTAQLKYLSPSVNRSNIMYGYHNILEKTTDPLFIVEGWFDAVNLNGVAIFGNKLTQDQIRILNQTNRQKVVIPDKFGSGNILAEQALGLGWNISLPDIGDCKDVNAAIQRYGILYTLRTIHDNIIEDYNLARVKLNLYCKR